MNEFNNKMKYFENTEEIPAEIYYHYTSLDALYNIVKSKAFWLTSLKSSNDRKELYYKPKEFLSDFSNVYCNEQDINTKKFFGFVDESIKSNGNKFFEECKKKTLPYALCLSERKDNLTHWDRYASGCTGICIGFNVSSLRVHMQRMSTSAFGIGLYDIQKVHYSSEQNEKHIRNLFLQIYNVFNEKGIMAATKTIRENGYKYASSIYIQLMKFCKNSSFVDEDEVRLYHDATSIKGTLRLIDELMSSIEPELQMNLKKNFAEMVKQIQIEEEKFCLTKSGIRSYRELYLKEVWGSGTIPEIILGPMCIQSRIELVRFLKANGLEGTKVSVSKVPIR